jgi:5-methylthioribose kinase
MELDIEDFQALRLYLAQHGHIQSGDEVAFERLTGGISNRAVRVSWPNGQGWILKQALPKLRVSVDWFSNPERIGVEAKALRWMNRSTPPGMTPRFVFEDAASHMLGMEAIPSEHENWKSVLLSGRIVADHFEQFGMLLGTIHRQSAQSEEDCRAFADTTYFENLRLDPYYLYTAEQVPEARKFLHNLVAETRRRKDCLVHGDFSPKNTLIYRGKLVLLDYEVFHFGEPAFDIGFAMAHFLSKAHHLGKDRQELARSAILFVEVYRREIASLQWAADLEPRLVAHSLGCSLARVAGKSLLEYMTPREMARQRDIVLQIMADPPVTVPELVSQFTEKIEAHAQD